MKRINKNQSGFGSIDILILVVVVVLLGAVGWYVYNRNQSSAASKSSATSNTTQTTQTTNESALAQQNFSAGGHKAANKVSLSVSPSSQRVSITQNLVISIYEDSLSNSVNAVQATLNYDAAVFDFVGIDASTSPFEISAQSTGGNGVITIARGHVGSLTGKQLVANFTLKPKVSSGKTTIKFASGSQIVSSTTNTDIIQQFVSGSYSLTH